MVQEVINNDNYILNENIKHVIDSYDIPMSDEATPITTDNV